MAFFLSLFFRQINSNCHTTTTQCVYKTVGGERGKTKKDQWLQNGVVTDVSYFNPSTENKEMRARPTVFPPPLAVTSPHPISILYPSNLLSKSLMFFAFRVTSFHDTLDQTAYDSSGVTLNYYYTIVEEFVGRRKQTQNTGRPSTTTMLKYNVFRLILQEGRAATAAVLLNKRLSAERALLLPRIGHYTRIYGAGDLSRFYDVKCR